VRMLQAGERVWLVLEERPLRSRFVIEYGPAVNQRTGETLMMDRVDHFTVKRSDRWPLGFYEELRQAEAACSRELGMPSFLAPERAPDGSIVTLAEQRARREAGLDPRTGLPRHR